MVKRTASPAGACGSGVGTTKSGAAAARGPRALTAFGTGSELVAPARCSATTIGCELVRPGIAALQVQLTEAAYHAFAVED